MLPHLPHCRLLRRAPSPPRPAVTSTGSSSPTRSTLPGVAAAVKPASVPRRIPAGRGGATPATAAADNTAGGSGAAAAAVATATTLATADDAVASTATSLRVAASASPTPSAHAAQSAAAAAASATVDGSRSWPYNSTSRVAGLGTGVHRNAGSTASNAAVTTGVAGEGMAQGTNTLRQPGSSEASACEGGAVRGRGKSGAEIRSAV